MFARLVFVASVMAACAMGRGAEAPVGHEYFPLGKGKTWKYVVTSKADDSADKPYFQTLAGEAAIDLAGKTYLPLGDDLYAQRDEGLFLAARREGGKVVAIDPPLQILPAKVQTGTSWKMLAGNLATVSTCLGARSVQTEAGKFETQCVLSATTSAGATTWQRQTYRFYARGVGLVRETITEEFAKAGGGKSLIEHTRDLVAFADDDQRIGPIKIKPAKPINAEQVRGVLVDSGGQPIAQVSLSLQRVDQPRLIPVQTDAAGRFSAGNLDPVGSYVLLVRLTGYKPEEMPLYSEDGSAVELQIKLQRAPTSGPSVGRAELVEWSQPVLLLAGPASQPSLLDEGRALAEKGDHPAAIAIYERYIKDQPDDTRAHAYLAASLIAQNKLDEAQATLDAAAKKRVVDFRVYEMQGQVQIVRGRVDEGIALYRRAAETSPSDAGTVYADLAAALAARNDPKLSEKIDAALKAAASADPPHLEALFSLGQSYASAGRQEGRAYLQRYLAESAKLPESQRDATKMRLAKQLIKALDAVRDLGGK